MPCEYLAFSLHIVCEDKRTSIRLHFAKDGKKSTEYLYAKQTRETSETQKHTFPLLEPLLGVFDYILLPNFKVAGSTAHFEY